MTQMLETIQKKATIDAEFLIFNNWKDLQKIAGKIKNDEALILMLAKRGMESFHPAMQSVSHHLNSDFRDRNYILIYPYANRNSEEGTGLYSRSVNNPDDFAEIGNLLGNLFK